MIVMSVLGKLQFSKSLSGLVKLFAFSADLSIRKRLFRGWISWLFVHLSNQWVRSFFSSAV